MVVRAKVAGIDSPEALAHALSGAYYLADDGLATTAYLALAIPWEERGLVHTFGPAYETYRRKVRWRMIPFLY